MPKNKNLFLIFGLEALFDIVILILGFDEFI